MRYVRPDHFSSGVWRPDGPLGFVKYTCIGCGHRSPTWAAFKAHRRDCPGDMARMGARMPTLDADQAAILADLLRQVDEGAA